MDLHEYGSHKLVSAEQAISNIRKGSRVFIGTGCGEPQHLIRAMVADMNMQDIMVYQMMSFTLADYIADDIFRRRFSLKRLFPNDSYSLKADGVILKATQNLVAHDFYIAEYYYRVGRYPAALLRFRSIISDYPDVGIHQKALVYIPLCEAKIAEQEAKKK